MNLRQLEYFCEVVACGSAARAAKRLFVAPTAISMALSQLEAQWGGALFDRAARPMPLTALGAYVHPRALELLAQARRLEGDAKRVAVASRGWLGIGFTRSVMLSVLPAAVRRFRTAYPDVRLELVELLSEHQAAQMAAGAIHIGISRYVEPVPPAPGVAATVLYEEPLLAALPAEHPLAAGEAITLEQLSAQPFISYPRDPQTRYAAQVLAATAARGCVLDVQHDAMEIHTALGLVAAGLGVTLVGASVATQVRPDVVLRPVAGLGATTTVVACVPEEGESPLARAFMGVLVGEGATDNML